ncbi:MAG: LemA family protein [Candidatus Paceibacterota bacterium]
MNIQIDEAYAQIEVQLTRRSDLIPNLVETVKGYASHEKEALENVVLARSKAVSATNISELSAADGFLTNALKGLLAVAEAYPDLKASTNFLQLQQELANTENQISFSRQFYNDSVRALNTAIKQIPTNVFAPLAKVKSRSFYEVEDDSIRIAPNIKF